jgi:hypothetical protein
MSRKPTAEEALALYRRLSPQEKKRFAEALENDPQAPQAIEPVVWLDTEEVAAILRKSASQVTRYVKAGLLAGNGNKWKLRIRADSLGRLLAEWLKDSYARWLKKARLPKETRAARGDLAKLRRARRRAQKDASPLEESEPDRVVAKYLPGEQNREAYIREGVREPVTRGSLGEDYDDMIWEKLERLAQASRAARRAPDEFNRACDRRDWHEALLAPLPFWS